MICLDFDGVLFDTAKEAFIMANKAYFGTSSECDELENYEQFLLLRPFIVSAWQYLLVLDLISENLEKEDLLLKYKQQSVFKPTVKDRNFEYKFNDVRNDMIYKDRNKWLDLHEPYPFFRQIKSMLIKCPQYFQIVSTKNKKFILELLHNQGVYLKDSQVWGRDEFEEFGQSKAELLKCYSNTTPILFIDDNCKHLNEAGLLNNVETILANWGYTETNNVSDNTKLVVTKIKKYLSTLCHC
jgi:hypothetical protein